MRPKSFDFSIEEKEINFNKISSYFYQSNFGEMSKADMELLMFSFYLDKIIALNTDVNGILNYSSCSDYNISKDLGITQQRVRNLKIKKQLKHPQTFDWKQSFFQLMQNARYDDKNGKIIVNIPDPNLYIELQNFIEEGGGYVDTQLNGKVLQIRAEYYIALTLMNEDSTHQKKILKQIKKDLKDKNGYERELEQKNIGKDLIDAGVDVSTIVANIAGLFSPSNLLAKSILSIIK